MRNLKMKNKLLVSFGSIILLTLILAGASLTGLRALNNHIDLVMEKTMPNIERIWEMRRNLMHESTYLLIAMEEQDTNAILDALNTAKESVDRNEVLLEEFKANSSVSKELMIELENSINKQESVRREFSDLVKLGTEEGDMKAYALLHQSILPLMADEANVLRTIADEQQEISVQRDEESYGLYVFLEVLTVLLIVFTLIIVIVVMTKLMRAIMIPMNQIEDAAAALRHGDFSKEISYDSKDEFGNVCRHLQDSFDELRRIIETIQVEVEEVSKGNFAIEIQEKFPGETQAIQDSLEVLLLQMSHTFADIKAASEQIDCGSEQVAAGAQALAQGATEQASTIQELSARMDEISQKVTENANNAQTAGGLSTEAVQLADKTKEEMTDLMGSMHLISEKSNDIGKIVKVIEDIAFQTNILALNAAVEAARAGSAGKGFSVVADEVRSLAAKSAEAVKNTSSLIEDSIRAVQEGAQAAQNTKNSFQMLMDKMEEAVGLINNITDASTDQADAIREVTGGVDQIACVVQTNSATSEESAATSEELSSQATVLKKLIEGFQIAGSEKEVISREPEQVYENKGACCSKDDKY